MRSSSSSSEIARARSSFSDSSSKFLIMSDSSLGQDGQAKRPLNVKVEPPDFFERSIEQRAAARFERHNEGQGGVRITRFLQQCIDADSKLGEYRGDFGDDTRPISDDKTYVVRNHEIAAYRLWVLRKLSRIRWSGIGLPRNRVQVGHNRHGCRIAAGAESRKDNRAREFAICDHQVLVPLHVRDQRGKRNE